jgi:HAD superfamily hydrolase (TIGR01509 family)
VIEHVFFDFGGTLADVRPPIHFLRRFTATVASGTAGKAVSPPGGLRRFVRRLSYPWIAHLFTPVKDLHATLELLVGSGYTLHVLSNNSDLLLHQLRVIGLAEGFFTTVSWSEEIGWEKPDPRIFEVALGRAGADPAQSVYVGDDPRADVEGPRRIGMATVQVDYYGKAPDLGQIRVGTFAELPAVIAAIR